MAIIAPALIVKTLQDLGDQPVRVTRTIEIVGPASWAATMVEKYDWVRPGRLKQDLPSGSVEQRAYDVVPILFKPDTTE